MATILSTWTERFWQDLQPTQGRMNSSLRIVLASVITLLLLMTLRMPFAGLGMYYVFLIGRDSPAVSFRSGILSLLTLIAAIAAVLAVVILLTTIPWRACLASPLPSFLPGCSFVEYLPGLASTFGFIFCTLIALWETSAPAGSLVKQMLYLLGTISLAVASVVAVEYIFGTRHPAGDLQQERVTRYQSLEAMYSLYAQGADPAQIAQAISRVHSSLPRVRPECSESITSSSSATSKPARYLSVRASASQCWRSSWISRPPSRGSTRRSPILLRRRCAHIAELCRHLAAGTVPPDRHRS